LELAPNPASRTLGIASINPNYVIEISNTMAVKKRQKTLSHGRPPTSKPKERMTSERSRTIIRTHHRLQKEHAAALKRDDTKSAEEIARAIEQNGGIKTYQAASKQGQAKDRGGDSSKVLVDWLQQSHALDPKARDRSDAGKAVLRCLEVGALSTNNEISKYSSTISMTRIDLNSQGPGIEKQDFMERPLPATEDERFDIISLSLVLNYVPDAPGRGEMLKRLTQFLRKGAATADATADAKTSALPALFFVLPLPCVDNSRYLDEPLLLRIMRDLGFTMRYSKNTSKLCYYLFALTEEPTHVTTEKKKIRDGPGMNNFCIVVE
jgi:25S rRNA (adenine2142-N1)-methyltransferase